MNSFCSGRRREDTGATVHLDRLELGRTDQHRGETGVAYWRTIEIGNVRVRVVEFSPGYLADHWCDRGHILYVFEGELDTELKDARTFKLMPAMTYQVCDFGDAPHRSSTKTGAKLFVVD